MILLFFWVKIAAKKFISLLKVSPVIIIFTVIFTGAFLYAFVNNHIVLNPDSWTLYLIILFFVLISVLNSLKRYNVTPVLLAYSKSKNSNKHICIMFFIKRALLNNLFLIIINIFAYNINSITLICITVFSVFISFLIMYLKNIYINIKIKNNTEKILKINPKIKSIIYDYLTSDFSAMTVLCITMFLILVNEFSKNSAFDNDLKTQTHFFMLLTIIFGLGFIGIIDSIRNINRKFHAILSANDLKYHVKRTILFLAGIYCWLFAVFIYFGFTVSAALMFKYIFCILILFMISIFMAFTITNILLKSIIMILLLAFTVWISSLTSPFLIALIIPLVFAFAKAKNEYREWFLL
ncbi:MAG: hypothetical protein FWC03_00140 [Treponema sp.]|nr:hypothetical protein [Treponema sp.]